MKPRLAVLASGSGTTTEAVIMAGLCGQIEATVDLVISSRKDAGIVPRIADLNQAHGLAIESRIINSFTHPASPTETVAYGSQTKAEEAAILELLKNGQFDLILLLGYMKKVGPKLVETFGWRPDYTSLFQAKMVNTHPGLLPETIGLYGLNVQQHVMDHHLAYGGHTFHVVAEKYDEGPIITEHRVKVKPGDTAESFFERVKASEKQLLPLDIDQFIKDSAAFKKSR